MRLVGIECRGDVGRCHHDAEHIGRIGGFLIVGNVAADARPVHAPDAGVMRISNDRGRQPDLGLRQRRGIGAAGEIRNGIIGGSKPVGVDMAEIGDRRLRARIRAAIGQPQRRVIAAGIEGVDHGSIIRIAEDGVELAGGEIVQLCGDRCVRIGAALRRSGGGGAASACWPAHPATIAAQPP